MIKQLCLAAIFLVYAPNVFSMQDPKLSFEQICTERIVAMQPRTKPSVALWLRGTLQSLRPEVYAWACPIVRRVIARHSYLFGNAPEEKCGLMQEFIDNVFVSPALPAGHMQQPVGWPWVDAAMEADSDNSNDSDDSDDGQTKKMTDAETGKPIWYK